MYDATTTKYKVKALLSNGDKVTLTNVLTNITRSENERELAQKVTLSICNQNTDNGTLSSMLKLCTKIYLYAGSTEVFRGIIWDVTNAYSVSGKTIEITCYDNMIYTQNSKENFYFSKDKKTKSVIEAICKKAKINVKYGWEDYKHTEAICYRKQNISDSIIDTLEEAAKKKGKTYVARMEKGILQIKKKGSNSTVYIFSSADKNVESTSRRLTLDGLVTKVLIVGKEPDSGTPPVKETVLGKTQYGVLQDIIQQSGDESISELKKEAKEILEEHGKPEETIIVEVVDVPFVNKGDKVKVVAGNLDGYFYVMSISRNGQSLTMKMELEKV